MRGDSAVRPETPGFGADLAESGAFRKVAPVAPSSFSAELCQLLYDLGVRRGFGIIGGANAAFVDALGKSPIDVTQFRHESGAGFAATELSLAARQPVLVFATTGPGLLNALNGVAAARWEGASVVLVSGCTAASQRGRWGAQETSAFTLPSELFTCGPLFDYASVIEDTSQLDAVGMRLAMGFARPNGFVAHLALPMNIQAARAAPAHRPRAQARAAAVDPALAAECAGVLSTSRFGVWVGHGARNVWRRVRQLVDLTGAPVISTPRGKGIVDESHERYLGVSGTGGWEDLYERVEAARLDRILVLGSRLGEGSSFWSPRLAPAKGFVHVDVDPSVPGSAFPSVDTLGVTAEIDAFLCALIEHWPRIDALPPAARGLLSNSGLPRRAVRERLEARAGLVRPDYLMQRLQDLVVRRSDAMIMADAGNAFTWTSQCLRLSTPNRYRVSTGYGSMGHMSSGVVGAALAGTRKAVAVVGDGSLLMNNELPTAAALGVNAVWIVLNDGRLGMVEQGMRCLGLEPVGCRFPRQDFVAIARAMGCDGRRVETEDEVDAAIESAMACDGPFLVDVLVDPDVPSPVTRRCECLLEQLAAAKGKRG